MTGALSNVINPYHLAVCILLLIKIDCLVNDIGDTSPFFLVWIQATKILYLSLTIAICYRHRTIVVNDDLFE